MRSPFYFYKWISRLESPDQNGASVNIRTEFLNFITRKAVQAQKLKKTETNLINYQCILTVYAAPGRIAALILTENLKTVGYTDDRILLESSTL